MSPRAVVWSVTLEPSENEALESAMSAHGLTIDSDGFEQFIRLVISGEFEGQNTSSPRLSGLESLLREHGPDFVRIGKIAIQTAARSWAGPKK